MNVVLRYEPGKLEDIRVLLRRGDFRLETRPNALLFATRPGVSLTAYGSGKLLLTGVQASEFAGILTGHGLAQGDAGEAATDAARTPSADFAPHAGSDESGKGDYFGPLSVAAVHVPDVATAELLVAKGVKDSKQLARLDAAPLASLIRHRCPHATVVLMPEHYNAIYARTGNLNELLAWAHARAIEDLLTRVGDVPVVVDQFARPEVLTRHLQERGRAARIQQVVRGEADVACAAASIVARAEFLAGIARLEQETGARLPLGAGPPVLRAGKDYVARNGAPALERVAKVHFATTRALTR